MYTYINFFSPLGTQSKKQRLSSADTLKAFFMDTAFLRLDSALHLLKSQALSSVPLMTGQFKLRLQAIRDVQISPGQTLFLVL